MSSQIDGMNTIDGTMPDSELTPIQRFYKSKSILMTGATGFLGRILLWKLLISCQDLKKIYVLLRPRMGANAQQRCQELKETILSFGVSIPPRQLRKLIPLDCDLSVPELGIESETQEEILNEVSVVFHLAAKIKMIGNFDEFEEPNIVVTKNVLEFCHQLKNLDIVIYCSTLFAFCNRKHIDETIPALPQNAWDFFEEKSRHSKPTPLDVIDGRPNNYTLSKAIVENKILQWKKDLPLTIFRPSIVAAAVRDPFPGWTSNINGMMIVPYSLIQGTMRTAKCNWDTVVDISPIDLTSNALIVAAWHGAAVKTSQPSTVVNYASGTLNPTTYAEVWSGCKKATEEVPCLTAIRKMTFSRPRNVRNLFGLVAYYFNFYVWELLFAYILQLIFYFLDIKTPILAKMKRMHFRMTNCEYFCVHEWQVATGNYENMLRDMNSKDRELFDCDLSKIEWRSYQVNLAKGIQKYFLKQPDELTEIARLRINMLHVTYRSCVLSLSVILLYFLWHSMF